MFALATFILFFSFFKEGERLSNSGSTSGTRAAFNLWGTIGILTNQFTFRFRACRFMAFPVTFRFLAYRFTFGFRGLAMSNTMRLFADCYAFGAVEHFATFIRAFNFTVWFFAFNVANSVLWFSAGSVAFRRFANWVANSGTMRIVTFP
jgi:hypothetical protein